MAEVAAERRPFVLPRSREEARAWAVANADILALAALMVIAAVFRFWDLGSRALHHDESLHAQFSWYLYEGRGYKHDPLMHGTFLFHANAVVYFLFGASDYTSRIVPALFGTALVGMPYFLRKQIGMKAVLIAAAFLAFSPTLLYFSRFIRNDIYIAVYTLAFVICIWRYLDEGKPLYLYLLAFFAALSFATKEVTFITLAVLVLFVNFMLAIELGRRREDEEVSDRRVLMRTALLMPTAFLVAAFWPLISRRPFGRDSLPPIGDVLIILGTFTLPQFAAGIQVVPASFGQRLASIVDPIPVIGAALADTSTRLFVGNQGYRAAAEDDMRIITVLVLLIVTAYVGLLWRPKTWLIAAAAFYVPFVLLYTTFLSNTAPPWTSRFWAGESGFWSGIWGSLDYWLDQHHVKRGDQPGYYYALLTPLYEFLPLILTIAGAAWLALKGDALKRWLLFWLAGMFIGLSIAGEKMPWLEVHIALPLALAGAVVLAAAVDRLGFAAENWGLPALLAALGALGVLLAVIGSGSGVAVLGWVLIGVMLAGLGVVYSREGPQGLGRAVLAVFVAALFALTVRASLMASFNHGDIPVEMLVYTQTSPDIPRIRDRIDAVARESGLGRNLPIVVDAVDGFSWPWAWYLREYRAATYVNLTPQFRPPPDAVLLIGRGNASLIDPAGYGQVEYHHRWWFQETYRNLTVGKVIATLTSWDGLKGLGRFFLYRRPAELPGSIGAVDGIAFFPESLVDIDSDRPAPAPVTLHDGRINIGARGVGIGQLTRPANIEVDSQGNIWVADSGNHRILKYDAAGNYLAMISRARDANVQINEAWSLAVAPDGTVFVADTWNHRIQRFSPDLRFEGAWGVPGGRPNPGPFDLFGPRDIAIAPDGTLWVTDTGHKRIVQYGPDGSAIAVYGGPGSAPGEFEEPVGLTFDAEGNLYVADAWNGRIQKFGPGFAPIAQYQVGWTSREVPAKPYIAVLTDGSIVVTDPANRSLILFDRNGNRLGAWRPEPDSYPVGVAATSDGGFVYSEAERGHLQFVPGPLVRSLFQ